ncbi:UDP-glucose 4-epimerase GalE [Cohnella zeiphila]|uniref:UDP-glucose 4-epimerase n=1 Tax=Cohnella zeiphila TaxID=2761120 RepID=A0A7X0VWK5_9BACL|nr:UDP-glucose 4-epimerase GalE [Cohnella zeiphila]MBB6732487.1 UDP-glucose 4-epimerase GalE [Cohnella zeiphila]
MRILVTGGAGYIGSHTCLQLLKAGHEIIVFDNLLNGKEEALLRVRDLAGCSFPFYADDLRDREAVERVFREHDIEAVIHFAGSKAVGESVRLPLDYYFNNVYGTLVLCDTMKRAGVQKMVFSSSATVYGMPSRCPIDETFPLTALNPYGRSKLMIEDILRDLSQSDPKWSIALLRYFNPIGAHRSGLIGEDPSGPPNNLLPCVTQVAVGKLPCLAVYGNDYPTPDGTAIRDYLHVEDLAAGHLKAVAKLSSLYGVEAYNLGTGRGWSVLEVVRAFEKATGRRVPYEIRDRRPGDAPIVFADPGKAERELGWTATRGLEEMCQDAWRWQSRNPNGYEVAVTAGAERLSS